MSLQFSGLCWNAVLTVTIFEPSGGLEDFGVFTPNDCGAIEGSHRDSDDCPLGDSQVLNHLAGLRADWFRERNHIVLGSLGWVD